jgi:hypothetical protein
MCEVALELKYNSLAYGRVSDVVLKVERGPLDPKKKGRP